MDLFAILSITFELLYVFIIVRLAQRDSAHVVMPLSLQCPVTVAANVAGSDGGVLPRQTTCMSGRNRIRSKP
jgi:hypothetical protein